LYPFALRDELSLSGPNDKASLDIEKPGRVNTLRWAKIPREDLASDEVEVEVYSAGLNFRVR
jgi:hypothetical protein